MNLPIRKCDGGVLLDIRLTPNSAQNRIEEVFVDAVGRSRLKVKVTVVPEKGKANSALVKLLSKSIKCGQGKFEIISGKLDRNKTVLVKGDPVAVEIELEEWLKTI